MDENLQISQRSITSITPLDTREIQLRVIDWRRIYRRIKAMRTSAGGRELYAGIAWGTTGSSLLALIPLHQSTQNTEPWVKPTFWIVSISSAIVGIIIWKLMKDSASNVTETKNEVMKDMEELHCLYFSNEDLNGE